MSRELYQRAARFYDQYPDGQYDEEAAHALRCHHDLLEALEKIIKQIGPGAHCLCGHFESCPNCDSTYNIIRRVVRDAIAKATQE